MGQTWKEESSSPRLARVPMMGMLKCEAARDTWKTICSLANARMTTGLCDCRRRQRLCTVWFIHHSPETMTLSIRRRSFHFQVGVDVVQGPAGVSAAAAAVVVVLDMVAICCHVRPQRSLFKEARFFWSTRDMVSMSTWSNIATSLTVSILLAAVWAIDTGR